jgi:predicted site-specific integrase-resolvase
MYEPVEPLLVNKENAAKMLGVGQVALNRLIRTGELSVIDLGRRSPRLSVEEIKSLIARRMKLTAAE